MTLITAMPGGNESQKDRVRRWGTGIARGIAEGLRILARHLGSAWSGTRMDLSATGRLVRACASGRYAAVPWEAALMLALAIAYVAFPADAIPDSIPVAGWMDDLLVLAWAVYRCRRAVRDFRRWEQRDRDLLAW